jgi:formamidopyrimidine-DNA glycosylase
MKTNAECFYEVLSWAQKLRPGDAVLLEAELVVGAGNYLAQDANWPPHLRGADSAIHYFEREGNLSMVPHLFGEHNELYYRLGRKNL